MKQVKRIKKEIKKMRRRLERMERMISVGEPNESVMEPPPIEPPAGIRLGEDTWQSNAGELYSDPTRTSLD